MSSKFAFENHWNSKPEFFFFFFNDEGELMEYNGTENGGKAGEVKVFQVI